MNLLLSAFGDWLGKNWIILVLIVCAIGLLLPTYLRQKKAANERSELNNTIKKGTKIITTAGVYGVVESIEDTTDGKVVTITTGNAKHPSSMTIHINAIGGIDNKKTVTDTEPVEEEVVAEEVATETADDNTESKPAKKTTTKKSTTKKSTSKK